MEMPDPARTWETFIQIPSDSLDNMPMLMMRKQVAPLIHDLTNRRMIDWYCTLIHDRHSGVPTTKDDDHQYWHIRFTLKGDVDPSSVQKLLPTYCVLTQKADLQKLWAFNQDLLKNRDIMQAWRIIGEQSEWFMRMLDIHREDANIYPNQIINFLHHFPNMAHLLCSWGCNGKWEMTCKVCHEPFLMPSPLCGKCRGMLPSPTIP